MDDPNILDNGLLSNEEAQELIGNVEEDEESDPELTAYNEVLDHFLSSAEEQKNCRKPVLPKLPRCGNRFRISLPYLSGNENNANSATDLKTPRKLNTDSSDVERAQGNSMTRSVSTPDIPFKHSKSTSEYKSTIQRKMPFHPSDDCNASGAFDNNSFRPLDGVNKENVAPNSYRNYLNKCPLQSSSKEGSLGASAGFSNPPLNNLYSNKSSYQHTNRKLTESVTKRDTKSVVTPRLPKTNAPITASGTEKYSWQSKALPHPKTPASKIIPTIDELLDAESKPYVKDKALDSTQTTQNKYIAPISEFQRPSIYYNDKSTHKITSTEHSRNLDSTHKSVHFVKELTPKTEEIKWLDESITDPFLLSALKKPFIHNTSHTNTATSIRSAHSSSREESSGSDKKSEELPKSDTTKEFSTKSTSNPFQKPNTPHLPPTSKVLLNLNDKLDMVLPDVKPPISTKQKLPDIDKPAVKTPAEPVKQAARAPPSVTDAPSAPATATMTMEPLMVNNKLYFNLGVLGKGGSSVVYDAYSSEMKTMVAVKVVQLKDADEETLTGYRNETEILKRLQHSPRIVKLYDCEETEFELRLVMERGSTDLANVLQNTKGKNGEPIQPVTVKHYWLGMLSAVQAIHKEGIIHSDLKPANFLLVRELLKLIDFGIATSVQQDVTSVLKDSQAGTFNYMSPESLNDIRTGPIINGMAGDKPCVKISTKSDVWSLGCILYNVVYSRTPFHHIRNNFQKLAAIANPNTVIEFPPISDENLLDTMKLCLQHNPRDRPPIEELLRHPYLTGI